MGGENESNLLKNQFDALVQDESVAADSIEKIFDMQFRSRFSELISRAGDRRSRTGTTAGYDAFYKGVFPEN
jgi:hypothetical protein